MTRKVRGISTESQDDDDRGDSLRLGFAGGEFREIMTATTTAIMCGVIGGDDSVGAVRGMPWWCQLEPLSKNCVISIAAVNSVCERGDSDHDGNRSFICFYFHKDQYQNGSQDATTNVFSRD